MSIKIECDCGKKAKVPDDVAGRKIKCPGCGAVLRVPGEKAEKASKSGRSKRIKSTRRTQSSRRTEMAADQSANVGSKRLGSFDSQRLSRPQDIKQSAIQDVLFVKDLTTRTHGDLVFSKNSLYYVQLGEGHVPPEGVENRPPGLQPKELGTKFPGSFKIKKKTIEQYRFADNGKFTVWSDKGRFAWYLPMKYKPVIEIHLG